MIPDRRVHAIMHDSSVIVRYDRAGKWFQEWPAYAMIPRRRLSLEKAARLALSPEAQSVYLCMPGGRMFDATVKQLMKGE
jgi:hypothetical protein